ncbi:hypothetical protein [Weissella cibaria]|uniref:hypothetical protein n=1 Tax=Weissella cibaria TaxID=137591 RepID=UPI001370463C|nr:hypothetical protein [Weissella cibaria]MYV36591.1 hypothetical protein [Weissella cibaria]
MAKNSKTFLALMITVPIIAVGAGGAFMYQNSQLAHKPEEKMTKMERELSSLKAEKKVSESKKASETARSNSDKQKKSETSEISEHSVESESSLASSQAKTTESSSSVESPNDVFDDLPQTTQLALLAEAMFDGQAPVGSGAHKMFLPYMGLKNSIVIQSLDGAGGWIGHTQKFVDHHNGTFSMYRPDTTVSNADADETNTTWKFYKTVTKEEMLNQYYASSTQRSVVDAVGNTFDMSTSGQIFSPLPN